MVDRMKYIKKRCRKVLHHAAVVRRCVLIALLLCCFSPAVEAQESNCAFRNTAFKSGEFLSYNLYYNWKFV